MSAPMLDDAVIASVLPAIRMTAMSVVRSLNAPMPVSLDASDLVQIGVLALIDAAGRHDAGKGANLASFASHRIRGAMIDAIRDVSWPRHTRELQRRAKQSEERLTHETGRRPTHEEVAASVGVTPDRLTRTYARCRDYLTESARLEMNLDRENPNGADEYERRRLAIELLKAVRFPRDRHAVRLYFWGGLSEKEIAARFGITECRVSQLINRALKQMRARYEELPCCTAA